MSQSSMDPVEAGRVAEEILAGLSKAVIGYRWETRTIMEAFLANGHVLLEGVPGIAKTTIARGLARLMGLSGETIVLDGVPFKGFSRIQFTPDLVPGDITGSLVYNPARRVFETHYGPVFAYLVLADEINRAVPRTQSALLQAMQERSVTIGDKTYRLEDRGKGKFFLVIATQNPVEQEGTFPLPEAQLDRFAVRILMGYPETLEEEKEILRLHEHRIREPLEDLEPVVEPSWLVRAQEAVAKGVKVPEEVLDYAAKLVRATRPEIVDFMSEYFELGASPRAGIMLVRVAKARAALEGRDTVARQDIDAVAFPVLNHRLIPRLEKVLEEGGGHRARLRVLEKGVEEALKLAKQM